MNADALHLLADYALRATDCDVERLAIYDAIIHTARQMREGMTISDDQHALGRIAAEATEAADAIRHADRMQLQFRNLITRQP